MGGDGVDALHHVGYRWGVGRIFEGGERTSKEADGLHAERDSSCERAMRARECVPSSSSLLVRSSVPRRIRICFQKVKAKKYRGGMRALRAQCSMAAKAETSRK
jgi:hypothetical protein